MEIAEVRLRSLSVPFVEPAPWRFGTLHGISGFLVEVETSDGLIGAGEAPGIPNMGVVREALEYLRGWAVGEDPRRVGRFLRLASERGVHSDPYVANVAVAAIEMALWDICGKAIGCPAHQLLGGLDAEEVPFYWHVNSPQLDPDVARERAAEGLERGFETLYLKVGFEIEGDIALARAIREEVGPGPRLRLDPNEGWTPSQVGRALAELDELELEFLEQPFDMHDHDAAVELRRLGRVRIAANQSAWLASDVSEVLERGAADVVVTGLHQIGGMLPLRDSAVLCRAAGVPLVRHSLCDLGVATAAALQVLGTLPPEQLAHQTHLTLLEHDLVSPSWRFDRGHLPVPRGPGLGVDLDHAAITEAEERFRRAGEYASYGNPPSHPS